MKTKRFSDNTTLVHTGRDRARHPEFVNPPLYRASTVLFESHAALRDAVQHPDDQPFYGRLGTPTTRAFEEAVAALDGAPKAMAFPSGVAAIQAALLAFLNAGDHILVPDNVYEVVRSICRKTLARFGIETTYYDPMAGIEIAALMRENTRLVLVEAPGSLTFEVPDIPAIASVAKTHGAVVVMDNTWATSLYFKPFEHGVDVAIQSASKYIGGHADIMLGVASATAEAWRPLRSTGLLLGHCAGPEETYLGLRGLRTLAPRLNHHQESGLRVARWLCEQDAVLDVLHPALEGTPGHAIWKRDFKGAAGVFGFTMKQAGDQAIAAFVDRLKLFGMGFSWGGFESLILPARPVGVRTVVPWDETKSLFRLSIGFEDPDDLIADLAAGIKRYSAALSAG